MKHTKIAAALTAAMLLGSMTSAMPAIAEGGETLLSTGFEDGVGAWMGFGPADVSVSNNMWHEGKQCLYIGGRTENWQGAFCSMEGTLTAGSTYSFSAYVNCKAGDTVQLMLKYTDGEGEQYKEIGSASGEWALIEEDYAIPSGVKDILIYFQTAEGSNDFQVDDVKVTGQASWAKGMLEEEPLKDIYANYFKMGCAATPDELSSPISQDIVKRHFNSLTIGNELKPDYVMNQTMTLASGSNTQVAVSLDKARSLLSFCEKNHIPIRGHVLCWYSQTPQWFFKEGFKDDGAFVSKEMMQTRLENYIRLLFGQIQVEFPDLEIYCWDVVNECYLDKGNLRPAGTDTQKEESLWSMIYGDDTYIDDAFTYARMYAPEGTKLFYNDFNEYIPEKRDAIYNKVSSLKAKGLIDGVGMQSHLDVSYPDASLYRQAIDKYNELGLEIQITELDITDYDSGADSQSVANAYKKIMKEIVDAKKSGANITAVVFWGITDGTSWRKKGYPLLMNADYSPKKAYYSVKNAIPESEWGKAEEPTDPLPTETVGPTQPTEPTDGKVHLKPGDVYADDKVNVQDIILMTKYLHGLTDKAIEYPVFPEYVASGTPWDLNDDNECDIFDLGLLKRKVMEGQADPDLG
ncbi:MAG: endo-1,4-beta-xylanase [Oscillospiraceae bacterium]|nr:endo-1,4-beta-xylanase [Oscillospiraceae bacterium]